MNKKIISLILAMLMVFGAVGAVGAVDTVSVDNIRTDYKAFISYNNPDKYTVIDLPSSIDGYTLAEIGIMEAPAQVGGGFSNIVAPIYTQNNTGDEYVLVSPKYSNSKSFPDKISWRFSFVDEIKIDTGDMQITLAPLNKCNFNDIATLEVSYLREGVTITEHYLYTFEDGYVVEYRSLSPRNLFHIF